MPPVTIKTFLVNDFSPRRGFSSNVVLNDGQQWKLKIVLTKSAPNDITVAFGTGDPKSVPLPGRLGQPFEIVIPKGKSESQIFTMPKVRNKSFVSSVVTNIGAFDGRTFKQCMVIVNNII